MHKKILIVFILITLVITATTNSFANELSDKQNKLNDIQQSQEEASGDLSQVESDITSQQKIIKEVQTEIQNQSEKVQKAKDDLTKAENDVTVRKNNLNKRLRTMYKNGTVGYLDVLFQSKSIYEFITNIEMVKKIYANDAMALKDLKKEYKKIKEKKELLENQEAELKVKQKQMQEAAARLQERKNELEATIDKLNETADSISAEIRSLQDTTITYKEGQFAWPSPGYTQITSEFGFRLHPILGIWKGHTGIDIGVPSGSTIVAAASGKVIYAGWYGGYGNAVIIDHGSGISTLYGHNNSLCVSTGQYVNRGKQISVSGSTGMSTGPHLHFEVRVNGDYVDPMTYF